MIPVYAREPFPTEVKATLFLAGPTPRDKSIPSWREDALNFLQASGFDGHVFIPENRDHSFNDGDGTFPYAEQVEWEEKGLNIADCILFWIPREKQTMPGFTTNDEYGVWKNSGKVVLGAPPEAEKVRYQQYYAKKYGTQVFDTLQGTCAAAVAKVMPGAHRTGGEVQVPQMVWNTKSFQGWYKALQEAGNELQSAKVLWTFRVGPTKNVVFAWVVHVEVYISAESRVKKNEFVLSRTDLSSVLMYRRGESFLDTKVVMVKEFRSPVRNSEGYVYELPGGSAHDASAEALETASEEIKEEVGVEISPDRLIEIQLRQMVATLSSHCSTLYSVELTEEEMTHLEENEGQVFGVEGDSERTYPIVMTLHEIMDGNLTDWATIGMIMKGLS